MLHAIFSRLFLYSLVLFSLMLVISLSHSIAERLEGLNQADPLQKLTQAPESPR